MAYMGVRAFICDIGVSAWLAEECLHVIGCMVSDIEVRG